MKQLTILLPLKWRKEIRFPMHPKCVPKFYLQKVPFSFSPSILSLQSSRAVLLYQSSDSPEKLGPCCPYGNADTQVFVGPRVRQSSPQYQKEVSFSQKAKKSYPAPGYFSMSPALQLGAEYNSQASWSCRNQSVRRLPILGREGNGFRRKGFSTSTTETMTSYGQLHSFTLLSTIPKHLPKEENKKRKE